MPLYRGSRRLLLRRRPAIITALPAPVFVSTGSMTNSTNTWSSSTVDIGTASATRRVIVMGTSPNSSGNTISSVTINGVSATVALDNSRAGTEWIGCVSAVVASGTTGVTVTFTMNGTLFAGANYAIYTVDDSTLLSSVPATGVAGTAGGTSLAPTVSQTVNGFILGATAWSSGASKTPVTITGYTTDATNTNGFYSFSLIPSPSTGTATATTTWTGSFTGNSALTAWR